MSSDSDASGPLRSLRWLNIGVTVVCAGAIFALVAFSQSPHRYGVAAVATGAFVIVATGFDILRSRKLRNRNAPSSRG